MTYVHFQHSDGTDIFGGKFMYVPRIGDKVVLDDESLDDDCVEKYPVLDVLFYPEADEVIVLLDTENCETDVIDNEDSAD